MKPVTFQEVLQTIEQNEPKKVTGLNRMGLPVLPPQVALKPVVPKQRVEPVVDQSPVEQPVMPSSIKGRANMFEKKIEPQPVKPSAFKK